MFYRFKSIIILLIVRKLWRYKYYYYYYIWAKNTFCLFNNTNSSTNILLIMRFFSFCYFKMSENVNSDDHKIFRQLQNGKTVFSVNHVNNVIDNDMYTCRSTFNDALGVAAVCNSNNDFRATLSALIQQNKMSFERLSLRIEKNSFDVCTINTCNNGYFVTLDFNNLLTKFNWRKSGQKARLWLNYIENVAKVRFESFKLDIVRNKLVDPSRNWYISLIME